MQNILILSLLALNWLAANWLGWILTEWKRPVFQFKPFNCRPCLTFWLTIVLSFIYIKVTGLELTTPQAWKLAALVLIAASINYYLVTSKIKIDE